MVSILQVWIVEAAVVSGKIEVKISDDLGILILDNPEYNILSFEVIKELRKKFLELEADSRVRAIIFTAKPGSKIFSTGADAREIIKLSLSGDRRRAAKVLEELHAFFSRIENSQKPTIAAVEGRCLGGGFELALACQYRVASAHALFCLPEIDLGIIPGLGGTQRLARIASPQDALRTILRGRSRFLTGKEALERGVITEVAEGDFVKAVKDFAQRAIAKNLPIRTVILPGFLQVSDFVQNGELAELSKGKSQVAVNAAVKAINEGLRMSLADGLILEQKLFIECLFDRETRWRFRKMYLGKKWERAKAACKKIVGRIFGKNKSPTPR